MSKNCLSALLVVGFLVACRPTCSVRTHYEKIAEQNGWLENYKKGAEIIRKLSAHDSKGQKKTDMAAYRGERVAFVGVGAPPGATNDLLTTAGYYLRVVAKNGKDLRPQSAWWEVLVCGELLQVLQENKIIVIEIDEKDWIILQTG